MTHVFVDNTFSHRLARALNELEGRFDIEHLRHKLGGGTPDPEWLQAVRDRPGRWVLFTEDRRILTQHYAIWRESGLPTLFFKQQWVDLRMWDQVPHLARQWKRIAKAVRTMKRGDAYYVPLRATLDPVNVVHLDAREQRKQRKAKSRGAKARREA